MSSYLLSGQGKHGLGRSFIQTPQDFVATHNFSFLHPQTITKNSPPANMVSQMIADDVLLCIQMCSDKKCIVGKNEQVCGYLTCITTDEMALKPAIEYDSSHGLVGLLEPQCIPYQDVKELLEKSTEEIVGYIQTQGFVTQARKVIVASLDGNDDFPVGVYYCGNKGDANYVEGLFQDIVSTAKKCSSCLSSESECNFYCLQCYRKKSLCDHCAVVGYTNWNPLLRPCKSCLELHVICYRLSNVCWTTDCDSKQNGFMLRDNERYPYQVPIPDCPHNIKSVRSAEFWYWIDVDGYLVDARLLLLLRRHEPNDGSRNKMRECVSLKALRNKGKMDVETAVELHRKDVQEAIPDKKVAATLVTELEFKFWKRN